MEITALPAPPSATLDVPPVDIRMDDERSPTTPKLPAAAVPAETAQEESVADSAIATPTRHSFGGVEGQMALPAEPFTPQTQQDRTSEFHASLKRDGSTRSSMSQLDDGGHDVAMGEGEEDDIGDEDGSDNESVTSDSQRPSKKKKGQRFFCTEFPPCQLSFTRSEHLARHIRKHTGERPFQCHCSRRFSRLDNLRQHAQTVHVNEEIPGDSLAATSTRFQRQIRTDRVRPPTNRSRAATISSSGGGHSRGHSRNLSTSSIGSTSSSISAADDMRRRPQPLAMANDPSSRARLSINTYNNITGSPGQSQYIYYANSPTGYSTPTSTSFSTGHGSPYLQSSMASPVSTISRSSFYNGARQSRRLSVPSGPNPFQNPNGNTYPPPVYFNPVPAGSPGTYSQTSSVFGSPSSSTFSHVRRDSETEIEMRRRTWHPSTYSNYSQRPPTSGLSYHQTPDDQRPALSEQPAASQVTRLPGIESFDHAPPSTSRQPSSPMMVDSSPVPAPSSAARPSTDSGLHQNLTKLDIAAANAPLEGQWQITQPQQMAPQGYIQHQAIAIAPQQAQQQQQPPAPPAPMNEPPVTPRRNKRQAWYGGPVSGPITPQSNGQPVAATHRPSPEDSGSSDGVPTPGTSQGVEYHPVIVNLHSNAEAYANAGLMGAEQKSHIRPLSQEQQQHQPRQTYALQAGHDPQFATTYPQPAGNDMGRLEALVAVATSEGRAAERQ